MSDHLPYDKTRREFLKRAYFFAAIPVLPFGVLSGCSRTSSATSQSTSSDTRNIPSKIVMVSANEPGEPLLISGTIFESDGIKPAKGAILSVWHTDAKGYYAEEGGEAGELHPRIHGRMQTGADGKYEFRTIKPAPYPNRTVPAHIHAHVSGQNYPEYAIANYVFEGDPFITAANRIELSSGHGGSQSIIALKRDEQGVSRGVRDIKLEYVKPSAETMRLLW